MWRLFTGFGNISKHILSVDGEHFTKFIKKRLGKMFENLFKYHFLECKMLEIYCSTVQNPVGDCMETITPIILFLKSFQPHLEPLLIYLISSYLRLKVRTNHLLCN